MNLFDECYSFKEKSFINLKLNGTTIEFNVKGKVR